MKTLRNIITLALLSVSLVSCADFLKFNSTTSLSETTAFDSKQALEAQMYSVYSALMSATGNKAMFYELSHASMMTHWVSKTSRDGKSYEQCLRGTLYATEDQGATIIKLFYATIGRCNNLLSGLQESPVDEKFKSEIEAEAKFIRAVSYFYLVRLFGDVPLILQPVQELEDSYTGRTPFNQVYAQILKDLTDAENGMRDKDEQIAATGYNGRPHKWAATSYKASVYLQIASILGYPEDQAFGTIKTGEFKVIPETTFAACVTPEAPNGIVSATQAWRLALDTAEDVIDSKRYQLASDYRQLFAWDRDNPLVYNLDERILVVQSTSNGGGSSVAIYTLPRTFYGTEDYTVGGSNLGRRVNPNRWIYRKWCEDYEGTQPDDYLSKTYYSKYVCADPRLDASYIHTRYLVYDGSKDKTMEQFSYPAVIKSGSTWDETQYVVTGSNRHHAPHFRKYFSKQFKQDNGYADYYLMRYAEIYLIAAEAAAELGEDATSEAHIETLHARARVSRDGAASAMPSWSGKTFASKEERIAAIMWERIYELSGEGHEWFDNHRRGAGWLLKNIYEPLHAFLLEEENVPYSHLFRYTAEYGNYTLPLTLNDARCGLLCEYPEYEIRYNPALSDSDQNYFNQTMFTGTAGGGSGTEDPENPDQPDNPDNPNPDNPNPDNPDPDNPDNPDQPDNPNPDDPNPDDPNPDNPNPDTPDPDDPDQPDVPEVPGTGNAGNESFDQTEDNLDGTGTGAGNEDYKDNDEHIGTGNENFDPEQDNLSGTEDPNPPTPGTPDTPTPDVPDPPTPPTPEKPESGTAGNENFNPSEDDLSGNTPTGTTPPTSGDAANEGFDNNEDNLNNN